MTWMGGVTGNVCIIFSQVLLGDLRSKTNGSCDHTVDTVLLKSEITSSSQTWSIFYKMHKSSRSGQNIRTIIEFYAVYTPGSPTSLKLCQWQPLTVYPACKLSEGIPWPVGIPDWLLMLFLPLFEGTLTLFPSVTFYCFLTEQSVSLPHVRSGRRRWSCRFSSMTFTNSFWTSPASSAPLGFFSPCFVFFWFFVFCFFQVLLCAVVTVHSWERWAVPVTG